MLYVLVMDECTTFNREAFLQYVSDGADINYRMLDDNLNTPLHKAIQRRNLDWIRFLIENGADLKIPDEDEKSAMELAEESQSSAILNLLKQGMIGKNNVTNIDFQDIAGRLVLKKSKILVMKKCPTFHEFVELSHQDVFQDILNAVSLFVIVLHLEEKPSIDECELIRFNQVCTKALILQVNSKSSDAIFCKNQNQDFQKLSIKELPMEATDAEYLDYFNFEFICNLKYHEPKTFGIFKWNLLEIRMFNEASINRMRLIEYAIRHQDILVLKFLLLFKPDFYSKNDKNQRILEVAVEESTLEIFEILLRFHKEFENDSCKLEVEEQKALNLNSDEGKSLLMIAVESEKHEIMKFLIKCGLRFTLTVSDSTNAFESALEIENYDLAVKIL